MRALVRPFLLFLVFCLCYGKAYCQGWQRLHPLTTRSELSAVFFADSLTGYTSGSGGNILNLTSIFFPSSNRGYAAGSNGTILRTGNKTFTGKVMIL